MHQFYKDGGFLTEAGKQFLSQFNKELNNLLLDPIVNAMNEEQLRILGANLANIIGNKISESIQNIKK